MVFYSGFLHTNTHTHTLSTAQLTPLLSHPLSVRIITTSLHMHVLPGLSLPLCSRALCHPHLFESRLFGFVSVHQGCFRVCIILYCKVGTPLFGSVLMFCLYVWEWVRFFRLPVCFSVSFWLGALGYRKWSKLL